MNVFADHGSDNLSLQFWYAARYIQALCMLLFTFLLGRRIRPGLALATWTGVTTLLLCAICVWRVFPECYADGSGLTTFKKTSEYIISVLFLLSMLLLRWKRDELNHHLYWLISLSLLFAIGWALLSLSLCRNRFVPPNGHFFKIFFWFFLHGACSFG
jgi:hypothetical protein